MDHEPPAEAIPADEPTVAPASPVSAPTPGGGSVGAPSRRGFLIGGGAAVVAAAGTGVALGVRRSPHQPRTAPTPPATLLAALSAEQTLIAQLDASMAANPAHRGALVRMRADHVAHRSALRASVEYALAGASPPAGTSPSPAARARPLDAAALGAAEKRASAEAATRASRLSGGAATLLASIAACEATHVELLS